MDGQCAIVRTRVCLLLFFVDNCIDVRMHVSDTTLGEEGAQEERTFRILKFIERFQKDARSVVVWVVCQTSSEKQGGARSTFEPQHAWRHN